MQFFERKCLSHKDMILSRDNELSPGSIWKRLGLPYLKKRTQVVVLCLKTAGGRCVFMLFFILEKQYGSRSLDLGRRKKYPNGRST